MDAALENVRIWAAEGATHWIFRCEISQAKGQSEISGAFSHRLFRLNLFFKAGFVMNLAFFVARKRKDL